MRRRSIALLAAVMVGCAHPAPTPPSPGATTDPNDDPTGRDRVRVQAPPSGVEPLLVAEQLVLVTTANWDTTGGMLQRYERGGNDRPWRSVGRPVPVVVGRTGLAWDDRLVTRPGGPVKREGDGRAPAGIFPLSTVFGFASADASRWVRAPYLPIGAGTECVDDVSSVHYNTIVDRGAVSRVDWTSAERMRQIGQYQLGVVVDYNAPARAGRGSCIFLHIWGGPGSSTAGCTAMAEGDLRELVVWMDRARRPALVQLTTDAHAQVRESWGIP